MPSEIYNIWEKETQDLRIDEMIYPFLKLKNIIIKNNSEIYENRKMITKL